MIERYSDHAPNERTFLAWVRTAIAIMAFGFLVKKFDLFLEITSKSLDARTPSHTGQLIANIAGLLLIALGGLTLVLSVFRFRKTMREIDDKTAKVQSESLDVALAGLLVLLGLALFIYLSYNVVSRL